MLIVIKFIDTHLMSNPQISPEKYSMNNENNADSHVVGCFVDGIMGGGLY
jgi:hypothetical protein